MCSAGWLLPLEQERSNHEPRKTRAPLPSSCARSLAHFPCVHACGNKLRKKTPILFQSLDTFLLDSSESLLEESSSNFEQHREGVNNNNRPIIEEQLFEDVPHYAPPPATAVGAAITEVVFPPDEFVEGEPAFKRCYVVRRA